MVNVVTQPYRRPRNRAVDNYLMTLAHEYDLVRAVTESGATVDLSQFLAAHPAGKARIWAVGVSTAAKRAWAKMAPGDLVLFYGHNEVFACGTLASKTEWRDNNFIWPSGKDWNHVYSLSEFVEFPAGARVDYQSLRSLTSKLDLFSVGCRDVNDYGGSLQAVRDWVSTDGPRRSSSKNAKSGTKTKTTRWDIAPGTTLLRREIHERFGGNPQSGISSSAQTNNIFVFSDPEVGKQFGYDKHEGKHEDGSYRYTGEGQVGDQSPTSAGNAALMTADKKDKAIRLFIKQGTSATYIGEYTLGEPGHRVERALDRDKNERDVLVFNLMPVSQEAHLPKTGRAGKGQLGPLLSNRSSTSDWQPPNDGTINVPGKDTPVGDTTISRKEMRLQSDYGKWLQSKGMIVQRLSIPIDNGSVTMFPDLFNATDHQVVEAKKSSGRQFVREAIGQVLDYCNNLRHCDNPIDAKPVILLPARPAEDLLRLCAQLDIKVVCRESDEFEVCRMEAHGGKTGSTS